MTVLQPFVDGLMKAHLKSRFVSDLAGENLHLQLQVVQLVGVDHAGLCPSLNVVVDVFLPWPLRQAGYSDPKAGAHPERPKGSTVRITMAGRVFAYFDSVLPRH